MSQREAILALLYGQSISTVPAFSGLIHITAEGLTQEGLSSREIHEDSTKMAKAAASTFRLAGMPSATLPLDLCAPAEALGAELKFYDDGDYRFPQVVKSLFNSSKEITAALTERTDILKQGRIKLICEAIGLLKKDVGNEVVISGMIPGPYTLLLYICNPRNLFIEMKKEPQSVLDALFHLPFLLSRIGKAYREAGADFVTVHEMGGSPGFIGPSKFEQFVFPFAKQLIEELPRPTVLSVCGNTNKSMDLLGQTGADAISVDQTNDLAASRAGMAGTLLFGNIDPVATLWRGDAASIAEAVRGAKEAGVDAVWPGCDLVLQTSIESIRAMM